MRMFGSVQRFESAQRLRRARYKFLQSASRWIV